MRGGARQRGIITVGARNQIAVIVIRQAGVLAVIADQILQTPKAVIHTVQTALQGILRIESVFARAIPSGIQCVVDGVTEIISDVGQPMSVVVVIIHPGTIGLGDDIELANVIVGEGGGGGVHCAEGFGAT